MEISGASAGMNPNREDMPSYGSTGGIQQRDDQQVMGAQSTATAAPESRSGDQNETDVSRGFLDMDGETTAGRVDEDRSEGRTAGVEPALRNPGALLNGSSAAMPKATRHSRLGALLSDVSLAVQGVVKAPPAVRVQDPVERSGPGSVGTEGTVRTSGSGYATAVSEGDGAEQYLRPEAANSGFQAPLFSVEQAERLETMAKAAPLIYPEAQGVPEIPHSVSSGSGDAIQLEVKRQLQQFMAVQAGSAAFLTTSAVASVTQVGHGPVASGQAQVPTQAGQVPGALQAAQGIVQLQGVVADLAATKGSSTSAHGPSTEVVRPGISELTKLPSPTLEGALGFADWVHAIRPAMSDLSDSSGECWERLLSDAQDWYHNQYVQATPLARVRTKYATSPAERDVRWTRVRHRMEHLIIQACPDTVKSELSAARVSGVMSLLCKLHIVYKPGGVAERSEALRQVQSPQAADSPIDAVLKLRTWRRWLVRLTDLGGSPPDPAVCIVALEAITNQVTEFFEHLLAEQCQVEAKASQGATGEAATPAKAPHPKSTLPTNSGGDASKRLCRWFHDGKGCRKGGECSFVHDWASIPKADRATRCMRCGGQGHKKDTCTAPAGSPKARSEAGTPKAQPKEAQPKPKADAGLRKVLSEAAGVLKEALRSAGNDSEGPREGSSPSAKSAGGGAEGGSAAARAAAGPPVMATAAKIEAQLQDLEARVLEGNARVRAISAEEPTESSEPTALLDSGATHTVLDPTAVKASDDLLPCMVSLAGDQKQMWKQTPGGSLVASHRDRGGETQTILPLGSLIEQLGCSVKWSRKTGLQLTHPRLGKLDTSMRSGCPQISKRQALQLVRELEGAHVGELEGRLRRIQSRIAAQGHQEFQAVLDEFISSGSQGAAQKLVDRMPYLKDVPARITSKLATDLEAVQGWELLKALPLNRRMRKRLHNSSSWVLSLCSGRGDPGLKAMCQQQGYDLVEVDVLTSRGWDLTDAGLWRAITWAAYTGRVAAVIADPPVRSWQRMYTSEGPTQLRTPSAPWGVQGLKESSQTKLDNDILLSLQPLWVWTVASVARGQGVPFCLTEGKFADYDLQEQRESVLELFARWSNCKFYSAPWTIKGAQHTRPLQVCTNLGFSPDTLKGLASAQPRPEVATPAWPEGFKWQLRAALFGQGSAEQGSKVKVEACSQFPGRTEEEPGATAGPKGSPGCTEDTGQVPHVRAVDPADPGDQSDQEVMREFAAGPLVGEEGKVSDSKEAAREPAKPEEIPTLTPQQREGWKRHLEAHHIPFRRDCLQCVMSGALGLQHRRIKCPNMYALSFDLAGPFKELGRNERGGKYKYALVAGLRVPAVALPPEPPKRGSKKDPPQAPAGPSEDQSSPKADQAPLVVHPDSSEPPEREEDERSPEDPWEDHQGISGLSDEEFDREIAKLGFSGENKVLRFVVPLQGRSGAHILPALQEVVTECHRLGYPVKSAHTDRATEAVSKATTDWLQSQLIQPSFTQGDDPKSNGLAERLVGWVKARARLHLLASLSYEHWPTAMALACAEHRHQTLRLPGRVHQYGQRVVFKSKHPTGESKKPFLRWEYATYLTPSSQTDLGHVLLRESTGGYLIARNVRPTSELVDPERNPEVQQALEAEVPDEGPGDTPEVLRRVTGKRKVRAVTTASEALAEELLKGADYSPEACGRLLQLAFGGAITQSRRQHRGLIGFSVVLGAYGHGGLRGVTRATQAHKRLTAYLNRYLQQGAKTLTKAPQWSAITVVLADEVAVHRDVRNEPGTTNFLSTVTSRQMWLSEQASEGVEGAWKVEKGVTMTNPGGDEELGNEYQLGAQVVAFDARRHHAVSPATNWVIAGYSPLGTLKLPSKELDWLRELGFSPPIGAQGEQAQVCKLVGPNPQRMPMPRARQQQRRAVQTRSMNVRFARIPPEEWRALCELDEAQFEQGMERWTRVLSGADEVGVGRLPAAIPRGLLVGTLRDGRQWHDDPVLEYRLPDGSVVPVARVLQFTDDDSMYLDDSPFPDRLMMFDIIDLERDINEVIVIRVLMEEVRQAPEVMTERVLQEPGPLPPEVMAVRATGLASSSNDPFSSVPEQLPVPLPNPTSLKLRTDEAVLSKPPPREEQFAMKAEVATTDNLEELLAGLQEPLSITHTASQSEVRQCLERWRPSIEKELGDLKKSGVLVSQFGQEAKELMNQPGTTTIPLKGVFTAKGPSAGSSALFRRKCRLVACGNQTPHSDAESLYASGAPAELVRASLIEASGHMWGAYTCDIRSAFTLTPIPKEAGRRYVLKPPRWLIELGLAQEGECYTLGRVLYGFREAPVWWSEFRDEELKKASFAGCRLVQGEADSSVWKIMSGTALKGFLITYVDDFLVLSDDVVAKAFHAWILEGAKWETDGLSEASQESPVRFLGMQLKRYSDGSFTLDQEAYVDELTRSHGLTPSMRSKITCPKELMYGSPEEATESDSGSTKDAPPREDEGDVTKQAQRIAGECLWLSQRTRMDISFTTSVMCSLVATDPEKALAIGRRLLMYLAQTRDYKLRLKGDPNAPVLRIYTDASFSPEGRHSYGGHVLEFRGSPAVWRAGRQQLVAMSSAEAELIQVVEGCTYGESFLSLLGDLQVQCEGAQVEVDNTAAIALVKGGCSQRTRHLKVRGAKLNQLLRQGWSLNHCQGVYQKADILTKPLPSARLRFLCEMLGLGPGDSPEQPKVQKVKGVSKVFKVCLAGLLTSLQGVVCKGEESKPALQVEWPWELMLAVLLIVLSTVCLWETLRKGVGARTEQREDRLPRVRAVAASKERKAKRLQDRVTAAINAAVSESSPTGSESTVQPRKGRNKCPRSPGQAPSASPQHAPAVYGGVNIHLTQNPGDPQVETTGAQRQGYGDLFPIQGSFPAGPVGPPTSYSQPVQNPPPCQLGPSSSSAVPVRVPNEGFVQGPSQPRTNSQVTQTDPVIVLHPEASVYSSAGGHCIHCEIGCRGLRNAGHIHTRGICQYCLRKAGPRAGF
ncbi:RE1 [Symbiodinium sp. CCMP2592]|nr:RE1 [Symbiodinium sp. CCMP2592]